MGFKHSLSLCVCVCVCFASEAGYERVIMQRAITVTVTFNLKIASFVRSPTFSCHGYNLQLRCSLPEALYVHHWCSLQGWKNQKLGEYLVHIRQYGLELRNTLMLWLVSDVTCLTRATESRSPQMWRVKANPLLLALRCYSGESHEVETNRRASG